MKTDTNDPWCETAVQAASNDNTPNDRFEDSFVDKHHRRLSDSEQYLQKLCKSSLYLIYPLNVKLYVK